MKKLFTVATLLVIALSWSIVNSQEPTLKPSMSAPRAEGPPRLLLEVVANPALPAGYANVNGPTKIGKWIAISNFVRVPGSAPLSPPVQWVKIEPQFDGETGLSDDLIEIPKHFQLHQLKAKFSRQGAKKTQRRKGGSNASGGPLRLCDLCVFA